MKTVYYHAAPGEDGPETLSLCVTAKDYWDRNHLVDDGSGPDYGAIYAAMESCGAAEVCDSIFEIPGSGEAALVSAMAGRGFKLVKDPSFTAFLTGHMWNTRKEART